MAAFAATTMSAGQTRPDGSLLAGQAQQYFVASVLPSGEGNVISIVQTALAKAPLSRPSRTNAPKTEDITWPTFPS